MIGAVEGAFRRALGLVLKCQWITFQSGLFLVGPKSGLKPSSVWVGVFF